MAVRRWWKTHPQYQPYIIYTAITLWVMLPLLAPGHLLTLDMAFTPRMPMPEIDSSSFLFRFLLHVLNYIIPSDILGKLILAAALLLSGCTMHRLVTYLGGKTWEADEYGLWAPYIAGMFYMINPYTYSRFMAGHYSVLLGYSLMPLFVRLLLQFLTRPSKSSALWLGLCAALIGIFSIHTLGLLLLLVLCGTILTFWRRRDRREYVASLIKPTAIALVIFLAASCNWLVPFILGSSKASQYVSTFSAADQAAFATTGGNIIGRIGNVVRLQGLWTEERGLYLLPQDQLAVWGLVAIIVWLLVIIGGVSLWRRRQRFIAAFFVSSGLLAVLISIGLADNMFQRLPFFEGYREPFKFAGLLAMMYAVFLAWGVRAVLHQIRQQGGEFAASAALCFCLVVPVAFAPTMPWGFAGQLRPRQYPADWYKVDQFLSEGEGKALFLPWHLYMHFGFAGRIIINPADDFFKKEVIVSNDPEFGSIGTMDDDPTKQKLAAEILPSASRRHDLATRLAELDIKHVILAKETDSKDYAYLASQPSLVPIYDGANLTVYKNNLYKEK